MTYTRPVRVRFAPSPTGDLHIGGVRTALFNWMFAHRYGGKFILRIEDTDRKRTKEASLNGIMEGLRWAGLNWDEGPDIGGPYGPYIQSERIALYQEWAHWLVEHDMAYRAYESPEELDTTNKAHSHQGYDRRARSLTRDDWARLDAEGKPFVIRFKVPLVGETTFVDMVRGPITYQNDKIQDAIMLKSDGWPTYHLAHIVDDHFMEITHVIRAEEWIPSTPLHKMIYDAFGWQMPQIAHVPVILGPDGGKMSKRPKNAAISDYLKKGGYLPTAISDYVKGGYLPEAVTNFLCNVGWNYGATDEKGEEVQVFSKEEAAAIFDITRVTQSGTRFDLVKLQWLNGEYIRRMDPVELAKLLREPLERAGLEVNMEVLLRVIPLIQERIKLLTDVVEWASFFFTEDVPLPSRDELIPKKMTAEQTQKALQCAYDTLTALPDFSHMTQEAALRPLAESLGIKPGQLFGAIRVAVTGRPVSPPLLESMEILGRDVSLKRIARAIDVLKSV